MGQIKALLYKNLQITKRLKAAWLCQILTPLICITLIKLMLLTNGNFKLSKVGLHTSSIFPTKFYPCNLITPKWTSMLKNMYHIHNKKRINLWTAQDNQTLAKFEYWIKHQPRLFTYSTTTPTGEELLNPQWKFIQNSSVQHLNEVLIQEIKQMNDLQIGVGPKTDILPDSASHINRLSLRYGIDVNIQINNLLFPEFHRRNGDSMYWFQPHGAANQDESGGRDSDIGRLLSTGFIAATESGVAHMNLFSNMYLQSIFQDDMVNVLAFVSPMVGMTFLRDLIRNALSVITINLFPCALCLGFPIMLFVLVLEKEQRIKQLLDVNGLKTTSYWAGFFLFNLMNLQLTLVLFLGLGYYWVDIEFFRESSLFVTVWFLTSWNFVQIGFALFASSFISRSGTATLVGYISSIFMVLLFSIMSQFLFANPGRLPMFFYLIPQSGLVRFIYLAVTKCIDFECMESIGDVWEGEMGFVFLSTHVQTVVYVVLGLIVNEPKFKDLVVGALLRPFGVGRKAGGGSWRPVDTRSDAAETSLVSLNTTVEKVGEGSIELMSPMDAPSRGKSGGRFNFQINPEPSNEDQFAESSARTEEQNLNNSAENQANQQKSSSNTNNRHREGNTRNSKIDISSKLDRHISAGKYQQKVNKTHPGDPRVILLAKNISKSFPHTKGLKKAVQSVSLKIEKDKIFGLLGPNGAGKTTFLSIITGILEQDEGAGWICGNSISNRLLHEGNIGFCPQFDILWPQLDVEQHLTFMGIFKGLDYSEASKSSKKLIKRLGLERDYKKSAVKLSGGMKRRCSLGMALSGQPKIILLDEPSSGLDPVKRRELWQLIKEVTAGKAVVLTTHLMEEADTLCDEIGMITNGKLRCVGESIYLKKEFTKGLKIQVVLEKARRGEEDRARILEMLQGRVAGLRLDYWFKGTLNFVIEGGRRGGLSELFGVMSGGLDGVEDWSVSLGTLEDVFMSVVKQFDESNIVSLDF